MSLIVQKFGGTSVADPEKIREAAGRAIRAQQNGHQVVVVVSAMGKNTDALVGLASEVCLAGGEPPAREMDMLLSTGEQVSVALMAMAVHDLGAKAVSLTGGQIGIRTDSSHTKARIQSISTDRVLRLLNEGHIVIAAGFQGIDDDLNITTLGRGGSDTTAVALAAVLGAEACEIYTDVDGVFTTDPRLMPTARKMTRVSHDEMLELASLGAGVMHSRSIEFGKKFGVPIHVRNSAVFTDQPGTVIGPKTETANRPVSGAALTRSEARISLRGVPDRPGTSLAIFAKLAEENVTVDMIVQNLGAEGLADISFTVLNSELRRAIDAVEFAAQQFGGCEINYDENVSKVSIVGLGMATQSGVADRMFRALADESINIFAITTSTIKVSALVSHDQGLAALRAVHNEFELEKPPLERASFGEKEAVKTTAVDAAAVVTRLQSMEDLTIHSVQLDASQALLTLTDVPDQPGVSATLFEAIAAAGLLVDIIVQGVGKQDHTNISFTVPAESVDAATDVAKRAAKEIGGTVAVEPSIAILSVNGIGVRSHTGVGIRMFGALSDAGINVEMISTSEMRVNAVIVGDKAEPGLKALQTAFADVLEQ